MDLDHPAAEEDVAGFGMNGLSASGRGQRGE